MFLKNDVDYEIKHIFINLIEYINSNLSYIRPIGDYENKDT